MHLSAAIQAGGGGGGLTLGTYVGIAWDLLTFVANNYCLDRFCTSEARYTGTDPQAQGVLSYLSDGDVRSPFLGLKFAI